MTFWHEQITDKSFVVLQAIRKEFPFILIGGWAVYYVSGQLKSKDIDIIVDYETLGALKKRFDVKKNERLHKYEIAQEGFDIDIYVPAWSDLGVPIEYIQKNTISIEGFTMPSSEILLTLKLYAYTQRKQSLKGKKDALDIISILLVTSFDPIRFKENLKDTHHEELESVLYEILDLYTDCPELSLNQKQYADAKKKIKKMLA